MGTFSIWHWLIVFSLLLIPVFFGFVGRVLALKRGRSAVGWFLFSMFFPPILLLLIFLPPVKRTQAGETHNE